MINIILADDHPVVRSGLRALLEPEADFKVLGEASDGLEAVTMAERLHPDVILLDLQFRGISGIEIASQLSRDARIGIIVFSVVGSEHYVLEAFRAGARGYVLKDSPAVELIQSIREVAAGRRYLCSRLLERPFLGEMVTCNSPDLYRRLTAREREVLQLSAEGHTCAEIANRLSISRRTAEVHRANMMRKLGLTSPAALYHFALKHSILIGSDSLRESKERV